jgi:replicative DNA helicase
VVVAARPGIGKTNWLCDLAIEFSIGESTAYISMDQSASNIANRMMSFIHDIPLSTIESEKFTKEQITKIRDGATEFESNRLLINDTQFNGIDDLIQFIQNCIVNHRTQIFFIDYLQMLFPRMSNLQENESAIANIMRQLRILCKQHEICIILAVQVTSSKKQVLSNTDILKAFDTLPSIEAEADKLLFMLDKEPLTFNISDTGIEKPIEIQMVKNRSGACVTIDAIHDLFYKRIVDIDSSEWGLED